MGTKKKEASRREKQGKTGDGLGNVRTKGENFYRDAKRVKALKMLTGGREQRNAAGEITQAAAFQNRDIPTARVEPNRKWFGNTRVVSQDTLSAFREAVATQSNDPYSVLLKSNKLPMSLIRDGEKTNNGVKEHKAKMAVETSPFGDVFGPKAQRKRVKLDVSQFADLAEDTEKSMDTYEERLEQQKLLSGNSGNDDSGERQYGLSLETVFGAGQSKRIWNELHKVMDSSDVIIHVLDARDPIGTRCLAVEKFLREEAPHKHLIFVLNKCDLVPTRVAAAWVRHLSKEHPTLAFHASITNSFGKGSLIQLLRQFSSLHSDRKQIAVGLIGSPNVGKSSIVNTLLKKKACTTAPVPGETKVWQYVTLMRRIYLVDSPGITAPSTLDTPTDLVLRGVVRIEKVDYPAQYMQALLDKVKKAHMERTYDINGFDSAEDFLEILARKWGRLLRGGEPDMDGVAKIVIHDFMRGKIPWFTPPPIDGDAQEGVRDGRRGKLGEMPRKRKLSDAGDMNESAEAQLQSEARLASSGESGTDFKDNEDEDGEFEGFADDTGSKSDTASSEQAAAVESDEANDDGGVLIDGSSDGVAVDVLEKEGKKVQSSKAKARPPKRTKTQK